MHTDLRKRPKALSSLQTLITAQCLGNKQPLKHMAHSQDSTELRISSVWDTRQLTVPHGMLTAYQAAFRILHSTGLQHTTSCLSSRCSPPPWGCTCQQTQPLRSRP
jgi:hypothetical protein